jgi:PhnB protein
LIMAEATSAIPIGVYPYLTVKGGKAALDFYKRAFEAAEEYRTYGEGGERIMHARFRVNGAAILLSDDFPEFRGGGETPPP